MITYIGHYDLLCATISVWAIQYVNFYCVGHPCRTSRPHYELQPFLYLWYVCLPTSAHDMHLTQPLRASVTVKYVFFCYFL